MLKAFSRSFKIEQMITGKSLVALFCLSSCNTCQPLRSCINTSSRITKGLSNCADLGGLQIIGDAVNGVTVRFGVPAIQIDHPRVVVNSENDAAGISRLNVRECRRRLIHRQREEERGALPTTLSTQMVRHAASTKLRLMANPKAVASVRRVADPSTCVKAWK